MGRTSFKGFGLPGGIGISMVFFFLSGITPMGCGSPKYLKNDAKTTNYEKASAGSDLSSTNSSPDSSSYDDHLSISAKPIAGTTLTSNPLDSIANPVLFDKETKRSLQQLGDTAASKFIDDVPESKVAQQIVENYKNSKNKEPGGHCLRVSKARFERAYEDVYGHPFYQDLPDSISRSVYSPREVFDFLYFSTSGAHDGWLSLPVQYRGKGNAGAIAYAGMGTLVDWFGIWSGELKPGAPMQVWKRRDDYEKVVRGERNKDFDPFGHSFIFIEYVRDKENKITGIRIADQGYQSYRPLLPNDYEVWWAVNLSI